MRAPPGLILDAGCGFGRNAVALAARGLSLVCLDCDHNRLKDLARLGPSKLKEAGPSSGTLYPVCADVKFWPFPRNCFSAIICVHIVGDALLEACRHSLVRNGYLYFETFGNQGQNYL